MLTVRFEDRFEGTKTDRASLEYGPYPFVQLTYDALCVGPDGEALAIYNGDSWRVLGSDEPAYSDVVIS